MKKEIAELNIKVCQIERRLNVVGEYYAPLYYPTFSSAINVPHWQWNRFSVADLTETCPEGNCKINGVWYDKKHVFFYDDVYKSIRKKIEGKE